MGKQFFFLYVIIGGDIFWQNCILSTPNTLFYIAGEINVEESGYTCRNILELLKLMWY